MTHHQASPMFGTLASFTIRGTSSQLHFILDCFVITKPNSKSRRSFSCNKLKLTCCDVELKIFFPGDAKRKKEQECSEYPNVAGELANDKMKGGSEEGKMGD